MATKIVWSKRSESNLKNIFDYISRDSEIYAIRFITKLIQHTESELINFPQIGKKVPEFYNTPLDFLKEIIFKGYRIIYQPQIELKQITIIAVLSGRMNIQKSMGI